MPRDASSVSAGANEKQRLEATKRIELRTVKPNTDGSATRRKGSQWQRIKIVMAGSLEAKGQSGAPWYASGSFDEEDAAQDAR